MCPDAKVKINCNKREKLKKAIFFVIEFSLDHPCFYNILQIIEDIGILPWFGFFFFNCFLNGNGCRFLKNSLFNVPRLFAHMPLFPCWVQ